MICKKCGKALPGEGVTCKFCGAMMDQSQLEERRAMSDPNQKFNAHLMSDRYGIDKSNIFNKEDAPKENKALGAALILIILLILIVLVILINTRS